MKKQEAKKEIQRLSKEIEAYNFQYYVLDQPTVSDKEYDDLLKSLVALEEKFPEFKDANSPSQRVGTKVAATAETVTHQTKMYSLDNTYSIDEIDQWRQRVEKGLNLKNVEYVVELKIDGVSASLRYQDGDFVLGATRGDGHVGENVTHTLKTIRSIPLKLKKIKEGLPKLLDVRGEVYMNRRDFEQLNKDRKAKDETLFANPRNAASGSLKLLDSRITAQRKLHCFIHSFGSLQGGPVYKKHWDFLASIKKAGLRVNPTSRLCKSFKQVIDYCLEYKDKRDSLAYEVDGVVIKVNALAYQSKLGATLKSPRWAVAYKFPAQQATTVIKKISIQVGRTGVLTPVAELEPVECGGVTISRSTLHNFDEVKRLKVKAGDSVLIERAGDVIPKIIKVVKSSGKNKSKSVTVPRKCPVCKGTIAKDKGDGVAYRCINPSCPKQLERSLIHFASRGAMDIEGLGVSVVNQLLEAGIAKDLADIYYIKREDLLRLELFKEKKADNLLKAIELSKRQPLSRFLFALGIVNIGEKAAQILAGRFPSIDTLQKASTDDIENIYELGQVMAESVTAFFKNAATKKLIKKFKKVGVNLTEPQRRQASHKLAGKKFIFTGELDSLSRTRAAEMVKTMGGNIVSSVSKKTDFVVVGNNPGSKYRKAVDLGLKILNQKEFEKLVSD